MAHERGSGLWSRLKTGAIVILSLVAAALAGCGEQTLSYGPGIKAPLEPRQTILPKEELAWENYRLTQRAEFALTAKLLSKRRYRWDELAGAAPWDFAVAWGPLSDEGLLNGTRIVQGGRLMYWHLYGLPIPLALIEQSSANLHLIPASPAVAEALSQVPRGAILTLEGRLVDVRLPDGRTIPTSLTRLDTGVGACEILRVESVRWRKPQRSEQRAAS